MDNLPISVMIPAKNAEETIGECLDSVQKNNPAEVIVVDGDSNDRTVEIARRYTDRIYSDGGKGRGFAILLGTEVAKQEYIAYVDSDVVLPEGTLSTMLAEFQGSGYISISAQAVPGIRHRSYWGWASYQHTRYSKLRRHQQYLSTAVCLFMRETILKYGFDISGRYLDDVSLEIRLARDGHRFGVSSAIVYHHHRTDLKSFVSYRFFLGRMAVVRFMRKWGPWHARFWPPLVMLYWLGFCLIKGKPGLIPYFVVNGIAGTAGMAKGFFELIKGPGR